MLLSTCLKRSALMSAFVRKHMIRSEVIPFAKRSTHINYIPIKNTISHPPISMSLNCMRSFNTTKINLQEEKPHDHARLWVIEKGTSAVLVVLIPFGLLIPNRIFDTLLAILISAHTFWGMEAVMVEYIRVLLFGPLIPKISIAFVYAMTILMLGGLFYLIFNDIGLCRAFWRIWRNMRKPRDSYKRR